MILTWHRPLLWFGAVMAALTLVCFAAMFIDHRELLGVNVWEKPLKFSISAAVYAFTWSWLIAQLRHFRRLAWWAGTVSAVLILLEMVIIVGAAAFDTTSHFNVSSPLNVTLWAIMAFSISAVWGATFVVSILLFRNALGDRARTLAIRAGAIIALVGMGLAFLMTGPQGDQITNYQGIIGAHTVGQADGGPGLPLLGWSTVAGDLRIPHFVGMHALQLLPAALIVIELLARRILRLRDETVRWRIVAIVAGTYALTLAVLTGQALRGQSIVRPDALTLAEGSLVALAALVSVVAVIARAPRQTPAPAFAREGAVPSR